MRKNVSIFDACANRLRMYLHSRSDSG
ncbi:MAG: PTS transporter subunit EIIB [Treponema sp.]|nr:PTS transporter subunit EIIB [Candidatus Treponema scatequi]